MNRQERKREYETKLYTVKEVAEKLKVNYYTVISILNRGELAYINLNNKSSERNYKMYRITYRALKKYLDQRTVVAIPQEGEEFK